MSYGSSYVCSVDLVIRLADFESDRNREITGLEGGDEPPFATFQEPSHDIDVVGGKSGHGGNFAVGVSALAHPEDVLQQVHGLMLAAGTVLDEAGYETVFLIGRHDEHGHLGLTKLTERFEAPLTANKIIERARSEEHTSELQSLMRISYAVFC